MDTFDIDIQQDVSLPETLVVQLRTAVETTLRRQGIATPASLVLLLTGDERMRALNHQYRDIDAPTDVLSFAAGEAMPGMEEMSRYLGDVVISQPYAARQAAAAGHSLAAELQLLAVHGVLHLLGHDHAEAEEKRHMWQAQTAILSELGLAAVTPTGDDDA